MLTQDFYLPLTQSILTQYPNLYIYLTVMRFQTEEFNFNIDKYSHYAYYKLNSNIALSRNAIGMHRNNFNTVAKAIPLEQIYSDEALCLMPLQVGDAGLKGVQQFEMRARNSWTRLFCYIYFHADLFHNMYCGAVKNIAAELKMDASDVSAKLIKLEEDHGIERSFYLIERAARSYAVADPWLSWGMKIKTKK